LQHPAVVQHVDPLQGHQGAVLRADGQHFHGGERGQGLLIGPQPTHVSCDPLRPMAPVTLPLRVPRLLSQGECPGHRFWGGRRVGGRAQRAERLPVISPQEAGV